MAIGVPPPCAERERPFGAPEVRLPSPRGYGGVLHARWSGPAGRAEGSPRHRLERLRGRAGGRGGRAGPGDHRSVQQGLRTRAHHGGRLRGLDRRNRRGRGAGSRRHRRDHHGAGLPVQ